MKPFVVLIVALAWGGLPLLAQKVSSTARASAAEDHWVDSVFATLDQDERLGQLMMIRAHSDKGPEHTAQVEELLRKYKVGSMCFFQGSPEKQIELINRYQKQAKLPLMMAIDGEWGLGMRMVASTMSFPRQLMLGAIQDNNLIYRMGQEIARQCRRVGLTVNFAPVADVNNNAANPVINSRSFGEDRSNVAQKAVQYMRGMQDEGVLACAKHFPGHGDTNVDSHYDLPVISHPRGRLDSLELYPFRELAAAGVGSMMVAHLQVPVLDDRPNRPTTLSQSTVSDLLRQELQFQGLIFTDAMEMKGVTKHFSAGQAEAEALLAGNDILCLPENLEATYAAIKRYIAAGQLSADDLDARVKRVLRYKYRLGLTRYQPLATARLKDDLFSPDAQALQRELIKAALTMVRNQDALIPFRRVDTLRLASLSLGASNTTPFQRRLSSYAKMPHFQAPKELSAEQQAEWLTTLAQYPIVVVGLHDLSPQPNRQFGLTESMIAFLKQLNRRTKVVLCVFGSPYTLRHFDDFPWVLEAYEGDEVVQDLSAQALFGAFGLKGKLPVTASPRSTYQTGVETSTALRLGFDLPATVGMSQDTLNHIDWVVEEAINSGAIPGGVVLVAKNGQVVFHRAYGHHTYTKRSPTAPDDIFDLASLTKVAATTLAVMALVEDQQLSLDQPLGAFLPDLAGTNKAELNLHDVMAHYAGLQSWLPFYKATLIDDGHGSKKPAPQYYRSVANDTFNVPVAANLFLRRDYVDSVFQIIRQSALRGSTSYKYSDLGFYLLSRAVKRLSGLRLDSFATRRFYAPLGLQHTAFNPLEHFSLDRIPPTEEDRYFRMQRVQGHVHDMGAAMLGGVSGHAGLFASAQDLAVLMQLILQQGYYGGEQYLRPETITAFTTRHPRSARRGLGFDMFPLGVRAPSNMSSLASPSTFGHTGFTGTCAWVDPQHQLVYIFLSNRTYPYSSNSRLERMHIRQRIQSIIYKSLRGQNPAKPVYYTSLEDPD